MGFLGKLVSGIKNVVSKVGDFAKKAVAFGAKIMNGPIGTILSFIPITAPFARAATMALNVANGALNGGGLKGIIGGLVQGMGGLGGVLGKAGSLLSGAGLATAGSLLSKAGSSGIGDIIGGLMSPPERAQQSTPVAQAETFNLQQLSAARFAEIFRQQQAA